MIKFVGIALFLLLGLGASAQKPGAIPVADQNEVAVRYFPNPATNIINFEFPSAVSRGFTLQIFSFVGRKVITVPVTSNRTTVNISTLFGGIYVFQLRDANGRILACNKFQVNK